MSKSKLCWCVFDSGGFVLQAFGFEISEALQLQSEGSKSWGNVTSWGQGWVGFWMMLVGLWLWKQCAIAVEGGGFVRVAAWQTLYYLYFNLLHLPVLDRTVDSRKIQIKIETDPQFLGAFWKTTSSFLWWWKWQKVHRCQYFSALKALNEEGWCNQGRVGLANIYVYTTLYIQPGSTFLSEPEFTLSCCQVQTLFLTWYNPWLFQNLHNKETKFWKMKRQSTGIIQIPWFMYVIVWFVLICVISYTRDFSNHKEPRHTFSRAFHFTFSSASEATIAHWLFRAWLSGPSWSEMNFHSLCLPWEVVLMFFMIAF